MLKLFRLKLSFNLLSKINEMYLIERNCNISNAVFGVLQGRFETQTTHVTNEHNLHVVASVNRNLQLKIL